MEEKRKQMSDEQAAMCSKKAKLTSTSTTSSPRSSDSETNGNAPNIAQKQMLILHLFLHQKERRDRKTSSLRLQHLLWIAAKQVIVWQLTSSSKLRSLGHDPSDYNINKSSFGRLREDYRKSSDNLLKQEFQAVPLIVHWDGKLLPDLQGSSQPCDRLTVIVTNLEGKF